MRIDDGGVGCCSLSAQKLDHFLSLHNKSSSLGHRKPNFLIPGHLSENCTEILQRFSSDVKKIHKQLQKQEITLTSSHRKKRQWRQAPRPSTVSLISRLLAQTAFTLSSEANRQLYQDAGRKQHMAEQNRQGENQASPGDV